MLRVLLTRLKAALCLGILSSCIFGALRVLLRVAKITACVPDEEQWLNLRPRNATVPTSTSQALCRSARSHSALSRSSYYVLDALTSLCQCIANHFTYSRNHFGTSGPA
jgi:hypothetical protein